MQLLRIAAVLSQLLVLVSSIVQDDWTFPQSPAFASTIEVGQQITIGWTANLQTWFPAYCPGCVLASANLYITSVGISGQLPFKHKIASNIDVTSELSLKWTVTLPFSEYTCNGCNAWAFIFTADGYNGEVSSSTFYVKQATSGSTTGSTTTAASTTTTSIVASSSTTLVTLTTSPSPSTSAATDTTSIPSTTPAVSEQTTGLSNGAKAGIGIGVALGALILIAIGWFLARWSRPKNEVVPPATAVTAASASPTKSEFGNVPRHRPLADFFTDIGNSPAWDPADTFYKPSDQRSASNLDSVRGLTPESSSYELLSKRG